MNHKTSYTVFVCLLSANLLFGQFIVKDSYIEITGLSNQGLVAGYETQAGPYSLWSPEFATTLNIGGLAPGNGVGSFARFSNDGHFLSGTSQGIDGAEMSRYEVATNQWTPLGNLGFVIDNTLSGGFAISGDGNTVVGNSWADTSGGFAYTHAVAWSQSEGLMDLGSLFANEGRSTRGNAVSDDGSVVVGWQDFNGPWKSAVWRKNPAGGYYPNEYLLIDPNGSATDEFNQLGECSAVSADGTWIGGYGDYANNNEPWIWSEATGLINLGVLAGGTQGFVSGMNADASIVVGWFDAGFGDPRIPFIWTPVDGLKNLNDFIHNDLGISTDDNQVYTANCISPNGHYIAGYGVNNATFNYFAYRVSLLPILGAHDVSQSGDIKVYPNPTTHMITIENDQKATCSIRNLEGQLVYQSQISRDLVLDISNFPVGMYLLSLVSADEIKTGKLLKK